MTEVGRIEERLLGRGHQDALLHQDFFGQVERFLEPRILNDIPFVPNPVSLSGSGMKCNGGTDLGYLQKQSVVVQRPLTGDIRRLAGKAGHLFHLWRFRVEQEIPVNPVTDPLEVTGSGSPVKKHVVVGRQFSGIGRPEQGRPAAPGEHPPCSASPSCSSSIRFEMDLF